MKEGGRCWFGVVTSHFVGVGVEGRVMFIWVFGEDSIGRFLVFIGWLIFKELTE